jgi:hypothetical protein
LTPERIYIYLPVNNCFDDVLHNSNHEIILGDYVLSHASRQICVANSVGLFLVRCVPGESPHVVIYACHFGHNSEMEAARIINYNTAVAPLR